MKARLLTGALFTAWVLYLLLRAEPSVPDAAFVALLGTIAVGGQHYLAIQEERSHALTRWMLSNRESIAAGGANYEGVVVTNDTPLV